MAESNSSGSDERKFDLRMRELVKTRQYLRQRVTRISNIVNGGIENLPIQKISSYTETLNSIKSEMPAINRQIYALSDAPDGDGDFSSSIVDNEAYEDSILESLQILRGQNNVHNHLDQSFVNNISLPNNSSKLRLPAVDLPTFSGDKSDNLEKFFHSLESMLSKHPLSEYEKYVYLVNQLRNAPKLLVNSLDIGDQTYIKAKELLEQAFASPLTQKYDVLSRLSELKLSITDDPYMFIGELRSIQSSMKHLKIDVDTIVQYFVWTGMNERFQTQLVQIIGDTKPCLTDINEYYFEATERYLKLNERIKESRNKYKNDRKSPNEFVKADARNTTSLAINVKSRSIIPCHLCVSDNAADTNHLIKDCKRYPQSRDKTKKLRELNYCSKCAFKNHSTNSCKFKFSSNCRVCNGEHMTYLCNKSEQVSTSNKMSWTQSVQFSGNEDQVLLPTFTLNIANNNIERDVRVLKDSGSQRSFVLSSIADQLGLPVVKDNVELVIHGFNSSKTIKSKIVKVPITCNSKVTYIECVVLPEINITLKISNLNDIVNTFLFKGYTLADRGLAGSDIIGNFGMVIGVEAESFLNAKTVLFGDKSNNSCFLDSSLGVLLMGDAKCMSDNLELLPHSDDGKIGCHTHTMSSEAWSYDDVFNEKSLDEATNEVLGNAAKYVMNYDDSEDENPVSVGNEKIANYILDNTSRNEEGRLIMPLPWNSSNKHRLGTNYNLSKKILLSNKHKLEKKDQINMYDQVFRDQQESGIIERIEDVEKFMAENPDYSMLPHMGIFKMDKATSKCRIVFLSNLSEKTAENPSAVSHNQAMETGPCLNHKLASSIIHARFDRYLLTFDLIKAFLSIGLRECDQNKLLCLWFRSVQKNDYSLIAFRNRRLSFGLRASPTVLMLALYKILILDTENDDPDTIKFKRAIYNGMYMDNGCFSSMNESELLKAYSLLPTIFSPYKFGLQQFTTNSAKLKSVLDEGEDEISGEAVKFFGMMWHTGEDRLSPNKIELDSKACSKRKILSSLHTVYDLFNIYSPMMNRAKLFFHTLQLQKNLTWDSKLPDETLKEWKNICRQINRTPPISIERFIGCREGLYDLIGFSDASTQIYGAVIYIKEVATNKVSFLSARNKIIPAKQTKRTVPSLELQAICLAAETVMSIYNDLAGPRIMLPIMIRNIHIFTDSMVTLQWIQSFFSSYSKMNKRSIFVMNRLENIAELCKEHPITFSFISGKSNPADCVTRCMSYEVVKKTQFYEGPDFLTDDWSDTDLSIVVPNPLSQSGNSETLEEQSCSLRASVEENPVEHIIPIKDCSSFGKVLNAYTGTIKFLSKFGQSNFNNNNMNPREVAWNKLISIEQQKCFPEIFSYFRTNNKILKDAPSLVFQLNLFLENDIIKVRGKLSHNFPVLLCPNSKLTELLIKDIHQDCCHAGIYGVLKELRKRFWVTKSFSTVKKILSRCITCRRINARPIKLSQNEYREARLNPPQIPFSYIYLDYMGPFKVKVKESTQKMWILILTCMWSRAINLLICYNADVKEFLRNLQIHVYQYGLFQKCISDLGSQISAGARIVSSFLDEPETHKFFESQGIQKTTFEQFPKGNSSLGSMVENCVKQTKNLYNKSIGKVVLELPEFELINAKITHIINRRPIAFKENLRDCSAYGEVPSAISPEALVRGYDLVSLNIIPQLQMVDDTSDSEYVFGTTNHIRENYLKLQRVHSKLKEQYHSEFVKNLIEQSVDKRDRYKPPMRRDLKVGDIVLLVEPLTKQNNYPMGIVRSVEINNLGETTSAVVFKGSTREKVYRHASSLILLLKGEDTTEEDSHSIDLDDPLKERSPKRLAAMRSEKLTTDLISRDLC